MNTLTKTAFASALALGAFTATTPAIAGDDGIVVQSQAAMEEWSQDVTRSLNRGLIQSERFSNTRPKSGIVQVRFTVGADGKAENVSLYRSSGHAPTDRVATRAVRWIARLGDAPVQNLRDQTFQANIIFAPDAPEHEALARKLEQMESARIASSGAEESVVTLGG